MRPAKPFYTFLYRGTYQVQFRDPETGKLLTRISTGKQTKFEADMTAFGWLRDGIPTGKDRRPRPTHFYYGINRAKEFLLVEKLTLADAQTLVEVLVSRGLVKSVVFCGTAAEETLESFLVRFWDPKSSPYVSEKRAFGHSVGDSHCVRALTRVRKYWIPALGSRLLGELQPSDLVQFAEGLLRDINLSSGTRNAVMLVGKTALAWAFKKDFISRDLTKGIPTITGAKEQRGILTVDEAKRLFGLDWPERKMRLANLTAAATGMRAGEVAGLKVSCLSGDTIAVNERFLEGQGLGPVKNKDRRVVRVDPRLVEELQQMGKLNPTNSGFVFWDERRDDVPVNPRSFNESLSGMLVSNFNRSGERVMDLAEASKYWDGRRIDFHSWRHFAISHASRTGANKKALMRASGHKTERIFDDYADHGLDDDLEESGLAFGKTYELITPLQ